jgi:hypothetical protein
MVRRIMAVAAVWAAVLSGGVAQAAEACQRQYHSVYVELDMSRYPQTTGHWIDAIDAGHDALLHIDRENADLHREQSLAGFPPRDGFHRDEYPVAASREGGTGASVRYIDPGDNTGSGASMGNQLRDWCEDQPFRIRFVP